MGDYDPSGFTVDEVNDYLATVDAAERKRVLAAEAAGQNRKGIIEGPHAGTDDNVTETKAQTFSDAAEAVTHADEKGYVGTSPEAERVGRPDKGLSQQAPGILDGSQPAPDPRPGVGDSQRG